MTPNDATTTFMCNNKWLTLGANVYQELAHEADFELGISKNGPEFEKLANDRLILV